MDKLVVLDLLELLDPQVLLDRMAKEDNLVLLDQADLVDQLVQEAGMERLVPPEVVDRLVPWEALATQDHRVHAAPTELQASLVLLGLMVERVSLGREDLRVAAAQQARQALRVPLDALELRDSQVPPDALGHLVPPGPQADKARQEIGDQSVLASWHCKAACRRLRRSSSMRRISPAASRAS